MEILLQESFLGVIHKPIDLSAAAAFPCLDFRLVGRGRRCFALVKERFWHFGPHMKQFKVYFIRREDAAEIGNRMPGLIRAVDSDKDRRQGCHGPPPFIRCRYAPDTMLIVWPLFTG